MRIVNLGTSHGDPTLTANQTSHLIECGGKYYLIDAGEGANASLIRLGLRASRLTAIFITHMHLDHSVCLPELIEQAFKYRSRFPDVRLAVHLPDAAAAIPLRDWIDVNVDRDLSADYDLRIYGPDAPYDDGTLAVTPVPNEHRSHLPPHPYRPNSYCLRVQGEGHAIFFSGDLSPVRPALHDFPLEAAQDTDALYIELVHYRFEQALPLFRRLRTKHLYFVHRGNHWQTPEGEAEAMDACRDLPFPVTMTHDGFETIL